MGAQWPRVYCARLFIEWSGFEPWPGTLCCVLGQDTLLSQCPSPPRCTNGYPELHATETGTSSDLMGHLVKSYSKSVCTVSCTYYGPNFETSVLAFDVKALKNTAG